MLFFELRFELRLDNILKTDFSWHSFGPQLYLTARFSLDGYFQGSSSWRGINYPSFYDDPDSDKWLEIEIGWAGDEIQEIIIRVWSSERRRCQDTTFTQIGCQIVNLVWVVSSSETGSRQLEKLDNNKGDGKRERELVAAYQVFTQGGGGHPVQTSGHRKTLNLRFGTLVLFPGTRREERRV